MPQGEERLTYVPGQPRVIDAGIEEEDYEVTIANIGKPGPQGWKQKSPGKFPYRMVTANVLGTEDNIRGGEKQVMFVVSLQPRALQSILEIAEAGGYPEQIDLPYPKRPGDPAVRH